MKKATPSLVALISLLVNSYIRHHIMTEKGSQQNFMDIPARKISMTIGGIRVIVQLRPNRTAEAIYKALPITAKANQWGEEFYCQLPDVKDFRETATTQVKVGDVAFWGMGGMLAVFFGRTPMSLGEDPVPADRVNIIGKIVGDPAVLRDAIGADTMVVKPLPEGE